MSPDRHARRALLAVCLVLPLTGHAQDAVSMEVVKAGQQGQGTPALIVHTHAPLDDLTVSVSCGGVRANHSGKTASGQHVRLDLAVPKGQHTCTGTLSIATADGGAGEMPLKFGVVMHPPLSVTVPRESLDLSGRALSVVVDRPAKDVGVEVITVGGDVIGRGGEGGGRWPAGAPIPVTWSDSGEEVVQLRVRATDVDGFWGQVDLFPWSYEVPHEDVVFASGKSVVEPDEAPKLEAALKEVQAVVDKYGSVAQINLYVAGFTDTVGPAVANQALSEARAKAIARWFADHGFAHPIHFQGFGEEALAVATPDNTDEAANRRATYIVAAEAPAASEALPGARWTRLK